MPPAPHPRLWERCPTGPEALEEMSYSPLSPACSPQPAQDPDGPCSGLLHQQTGRSSQGCRPGAAVGRRGAGLGKENPDGTEQSPEPRGCPDWPHPPPRPVTRSVSSSFSPCPEGDPDSLKPPDLRLHPWTRPAHRSGAALARPSPAQRCPSCHSHCGQQN